MDTSISPSIIGIIGTLAGTILGYFLNRLDRRGKIKFLQKKISFFLSPHRSKEGKKLMTLFYTSIDIYNSSRDPKVLRDLKLIIVDKKKIISKHGIMLPEEPNYLDIITLEAKKHIRLNAESFDIDGYPIPTYSPNLKFYFEYFTESNSRKKIKISEIKIRENKVQ